MIIFTSSDILPSWKYKLEAPADAQKKLQFKTLSTFHICPAFQFDRP